MLAWQIERGAGGCLSFEELKTIVSVLPAFSWSRHIRCKVKQENLIEIKSAVGRNRGFN